MTTRACLLSVLCLFHLQCVNKSNSINTDDDARLEADAGETPSPVTSSSASSTEDGQAPALGAETDTAEEDPTPSQTDDDDSALETPAEPEAEDPLPMADATPDAVAPPAEAGAAEAGSDAAVVAGDAQAACEELECCGVEDCADGMSCVSSTCVCNQGTKWCDGVCVADSVCCSSSECSGGRECIEGSCDCPSGTHACGLECVSDSDPQTCGTSCEACPEPSGGSAGCDGVRCTAECPMGQRVCGTACIPVADPCDYNCEAEQHDCGGHCVSSNSTSSCGTSCDPCSAPNNAEATCDGESCGFRCLPDYELCGEACIPASSCCIDDDCAEGQLCTSGSCVCPGGQKLCDGACIDDGACCEDAECGSGRGCIENDCVPVARECADFLITGIGQSLVNQSTTTHTDDFSLSCGQGVAADLAIDFLAPSAGWYQFDTAGSSFDTALALYSSCGAAELSCNDDAEGVSTSRIVRQVAAGERLIAVIDGKFGTTGQAVFNASPVTCPAADLSESSLPITQTTIGGANAHDGTCGGASLPERSYRFTPTSAGLYRFTVTSDAIVPALYVEQGAVCGGALLGCSQGQAGSAVSPDDRYPAVVTRRLAANQPVTVIVDSRVGSGSFTLDVEAIADTCPDATGVLPFDDSGDPVVSASIGPGSDPDLLSLSCTAPKGIGANGSPVTRSEHRYVYTHEANGAAFCQLIVRADTANFNYLGVALLDGLTCSGPEVFDSCATASVFDTYQEWDYSFTDDDVGDYVLVIEGGPTASLDYEIRWLCAFF